MSEPETVSRPRPDDKPGRGLIWPYLRPQLRQHWRLVLGGLLLNSISGVAVAFQTLTPKYLVDDVLAPPGVLPHRRFALLAALLSGYLLATLVARMLFWHVSYRLLMRVREAVLLDLRSRFFRHINAMCLRFHGRHNSGELFNYLFGTPLTQVQQFLNGISVMGPQQGFTVLASLVWVMGWDPVMVLVLTVSVFTSVWVSRNSQRRVKELHQEFQGRESVVSGRVADLIRGAREVKLYGVEDAVTREFDTQAAGLSQQTISRDTLSHIQWMKQESVGYGFFALLCAVGSWRYLYAGLKPGELLTYLTAFIALQGPLQQLFQLGTWGAMAEASFARIQAVLETPSTTPDPVASAELPPRGEIVFDDVRFRYDDSKTTLDGVSFRVPYGQRIALVGPSGAGKSTVAQLLLRLYDPDAGAVCLGGVDLRACRGADVRRLFGIVPQSPYFFQATVRDNLRLLAKGSDDTALRRACELAHAWEFVERLPHGLDTLIGENGSTLSGGQKQRLAIARALLADPPFLVFDEATSALDTVSERLIQAALDRNLGHRTAVFIAHRLATIRTCDRILVMDEGRVVQDGTFAGLRAAPGLFRDMVEADEFEENNVRPGVAMTTAA